MVNTSVEDSFKVWTLQPQQSLLPSLLPWLEQCFEASTFMRNPSEEACILFVNCPAMGVVSAIKHNYVIELVTSLLASRPSNSIAILVHPNRASEGRKTQP